MKYANILFMLVLTGAISLTLLLTGCDDSAETYGIVIGQELTVYKGFYKGCSGIVTDYSDYTSIDDMITLDDVQCIGVKLRYIRVEAKNTVK